MVDFTGIENSKPCPDCRQALVTKDRCERCQALADCRSGSAELAKWLEEWRVKLNDVTAERDQLRAEVDRLRAVVNDMGDLMADVRRQRDAATARAEAAEAIVATLRGALEDVHKALCGITGLGNMAKQVAVAYTAINAALAITPASAGNRIKAGALRETATELENLRDHIQEYIGPDDARDDIRRVCWNRAKDLRAEADRLEKEAANG